MNIQSVFKKENTIPIVFSFNDEYSKYFAVALQSIIENSNPIDKYDIVALVSDVIKDNQQILLNMIPKNFSLRFFEMNSYISKEFANIKLKTLQYYSADIYFRLFIPFLFKDYKKVLYLDSDIVIETDIKNFDFNIGNYQISAALDTIIPFLNTQSERLEHMKNVLHLENENLYFNSGVLLFNLEKINIEEYKDKLLQAFQVEELLFPDQDILNKIFQNNVKFLSRKWNFNSSPYVNDNFYEHIKGAYKEDFLYAKKQPSLIHFTSKYKPWNHNKNPNYESFWKYARKTPFYEEILYARNLATIVKSAKFMDLYLKIRKNDKIVLWGASLFLEEFLTNYKIETSNIVGIIDANSEKWGKQLGNYTIYAPDNIQTLNPNVVIITIINADYKTDIQQFLDNKCVKTKLVSIL